MSGLKLNASYTINVLTIPDDLSAAQNLFPLTDAPKLEGFNECAAGYFKVDIAAVDVSLCMGTVALGTLLVLRPDADITVKIVTAAGDGVAYVFAGGLTSPMFIKNFVGVKLSNPSGLAVTGRFCICGD